MNANTTKAEIYKDEGYRSMSAAFEVYNDRGYGLAEEIYQVCLEIELELQIIPFHSKQELKCFYKGRELKKRYIPDLIVFGCLVVELKSVSVLLPEHEAQLLNYLRISRQPVGYLVNFGHKGTLEWKRFILSEFIDVRAGGQSTWSSGAPPGKKLMP
jgi:GxxExxY protein